MKTQPAPEPVTDRKTIWVFTPSRTAPEDLEFILVQRQALLRDAVERVRESALTGSKHHLLFVGPRGCGKTHLVTLIVKRVEDDAALADTLRIAWLNEDETCTSPLELLLKIHVALEKRYPQEYRSEMAEPAFEMKPDAALSFISAHLLATLGSRTLLIVTENLDALFENLGESGQKQLRSFIQENPKFCLVATAQRLVDDLADRKRPFFGFFQTEHLKPLNAEQAGELLQNIARLQQKDGVVEFLATSRGRSRVLAIHHLSGGNHRIYIVLSQFITRDSVDALIEPFMKMVDELTPYYQERIRWLPPLQRKIVEFLCTTEGTVSVKEIAKKLFATPQTISSQLKELKEKGYVEANQRGRESLYEISEPLMRICVEVKDSQRHQPLRLLVDFLRVWYEDGELKSRLGQMKPATTACAYLEAAIQRNSAEGNLRKRILFEACRQSSSEKVPPVIRNMALESGESVSEELLLAIQSFDQGKLSDAIRCLGEAIAGEHVPAKKAVLLLFRADIYFSTGERGKEIDDYTSVIDLPNAPAQRVAMALVNRGYARGLSGEVQREIEDYTFVIGLLEAPVELVASALYNRGVAYGKAGDLQRAISDYTTVMGMPDAPFERVAMAFLNRGIAYYQAGELQRAIDDYTSVISLPEAPVEQIDKALHNRGVAHVKAGELQRAIEDYTTVIGLRDAPVEQVAEALLYRGSIYAKAGDLQRAIDDYTSVISLRDAPVEQVAKALYNRGCAHGLAGEVELEIEDYASVIGLPEAPVKQVAKALYNRGYAHGLAGEVQRSIKDYTSVIHLQDAPVEEVINALCNRGLTFLENNRRRESQADFETLIRRANVPVEYVADANLVLSRIHLSDGRWSEGFDHLRTSLELGGKVQPTLRRNVASLVGVLFSAGLNPEGRREKVKTLLDIYSDHQALPVLGESVVQHIGEVFRAGEPFPSEDNLEGWASAWELAAADVPDFRLSLRLLRTGVNYVKAGGKNPGVLLDLTSTERVILEQAFGLVGKDGAKG